MSHFVSVGVDLEDTAHELESDSARKMGQEPLGMLSKCHTFNIVKPTHINSSQKSENYYIILRKLTFTTPGGFYMVFSPKCTCQSDNPPVWRSGGSAIL